MATLVTQIGVETWVHNAGSNLVTQIGVESWVHNAGSILVSQIGLELWIDATTVPINAAGNADGFANVRSITDRAYLAVGKADGRATAGMVDLAPGSPLILDMGI